MTKKALMMLAMWLSLTSMTTLNACNSQVNKAVTKGTAGTQQSAAAAPSGGEVVVGAARTGEYVPLYSHLYSHDHEQP